MVIFISVLFVLILLTSIYYIIPHVDLIDISEVPKTYMINEENRIEMQKKYECAAYSSAFILRQLGIEENGEKLYNKYPRKLFGGVVAPKGILLFFRKRNIDASFLKGDINTLKKQVSKGIPVIVFIKVMPDKNYLHFVPVIGYDEENLYLAESLKYLVNCNEKYYTRKALYTDFELLWSSWIPLYKKCYLVVNKR